MSDLNNPAQPTEGDLARARRDLASQAAQEERKAAKERASKHFMESVSDAQRSLRRAVKAHGDGDRGMAENHLKAARMALKAAEDAARRWGWA